MSLCKHLKQQQDYLTRTLAISLRAFRVLQRKELHDARVPRHPVSSDNLRSPDESVLAL